MKQCRASLSDLQQIHTHNDTRVDCFQTDLYHFYLFIEELLLFIQQTQFRNIEQIAVIKPFQLSHKYIYINMNMEQLAQVSRLKTEHSGT